MFPIMLALSLMVSQPYYAQNYAGIIGLGLVRSSIGMFTVRTLENEYRYLLPMYM